MTPPERPPSKITVEDLLRLKRAERPPVEFWTTFEQQLRAKQLAAIVKRDPWWKAALAGRWSGLRRVQAPVGAAAVIALLFVTLREFRGPGATTPVGQSVTVSGERAVMSEADVALGTSARRDVHGSPITTVPSEMLAQVESRGTPATPASDRTNDFVSNETVTSTSPSGSAFAAATESSSNALESGVASDRSSGDLAMSSTLPAGRVDSFASGTRGLDSATVATTRASISEPLAQISSPRDVRRARLMAALLPAENAPETSSLASADRVTEKLREQQLFETVSRMGRVGDPFTLRF